MADNFDLQGWMRENKQGPFAGLNQETFKSSKPKSKTGLNEGLMGMIDLQPVGSLSEDLEEEYMDEESGKTIHVSGDDNFKVQYGGKDWTVEYDNHEVGDDITLSSGSEKKTGVVKNVSPNGDITIELNETMYEMEDDDMEGEEAPDTWYSDDTEDTEKMDFPSGGADTSFDKIQAGLVNVQSKMDSLLAGFKSGNVSKDMYVAKRKMLQSMRDKLEAQLAMSDDEDDSFEF